MDKTLTFDMQELNIIQLALRDAQTRYKDLIVTAPILAVRLNDAIESMKTLEDKIQEKFDEVLK